MLLYLLPGLLERASVRACLSKLSSLKLEANARDPAAYGKLQKLWMPKASWPWPSGLVSGIHAYPKENGLDGNARHPKEGGGQGNPTACHAYLLQYLSPPMPPCPRRHLGTYPSSHAAMVRMAKRTAVAKVELRARRRGVQSRKCNLKPRRKGNTEEEQEEPHVRNAAR